MRSEEMWREVKHLERERLGLSPDAANTAEARELLEAGWERRGDGPKAIWRRPEGGRWYAHYQVLDILRKERLDARVGIAALGEDAP